MRVRFDDIPRTDTVRAITIMKGKDTAIRMCLERDGVKDKLYPSATAAAKDHPGLEISKTPADMPDAVRHVRTSVMVTNMEPTAFLERIETVTQDEDYLRWWAEQQVQYENDKAAGIRP